MKHFVGPTTDAANGFTLVEVMVTIVVLTTALLSLYWMHVKSINTNKSANTTGAASCWATDRLEILLSRGYDHSDLRDDNGDGTGQDGNNDGIDDSGGNSVDYTGNAVDAAGGNFGLNRGLIYNAAGILTGVIEALADGRATSMDNSYTILWNVAVGVPVPNCKTIRVLVVSQDNGVIRAVPMTYIKSKAL